MNINDVLIAQLNAQITVGLPENLSECLALLWCRAAGLPLQGMEAEEQELVRDHFRLIVARATSSGQSGGHGFG